MRKVVRCAATILFQVLLCSIAAAETRFEVSFDKSVATGPLTGRVILILARADRPEPRFQIGPNATPIFGIDVEGLQPGQHAIIDSTTFGHPVESLAQLPAGDYYVQAMINVYTRCARGDGRVVWVHWDMGGRFFNVSPGNLYSDVQKVRLDPTVGYNLGVYLFEAFTKRAANPGSDATFEYGRPMKGHSWHSKNFADLLREMSEQVKKGEAQHPGSNAKGGQSKS